MNLKIIPVRKAVDCEKDYDRERWLKYARRIKKNPYVQASLALRDKDECAWCGGKITDGGDVHHISYDHACSFAGTIVVRLQTVQRHARKREVPDCERCRASDQVRFDACMNKLVLVHKLCNLEISKQQQEGGAAPEGE
jgi:hypothetical protein